MKPILALFFTLSFFSLTGQKINTNDISMGDPFLLSTPEGYYIWGTTGDGGFTTFFSNDLQEWEAREKALRFSDSPWGNRNFWAPEVCYYQGKYYMTYSCEQKPVQPNEPEGFRICLAVSDIPEGPYKVTNAPWFDNGWSCIDGHIFVDDDETPYLFFNKTGVVEEPWHLYGEIYVVRLKKDLSGFDGDPILASKAEQPWEDPDPEKKSICNEGAFVFKKEGVYYLTYSAGHYASPKYAIGYATAASPLGPWVKSDDNPLLAGDEAIGGPGHCSVSVAPDGGLLLCYHVHAERAKPSGDRRVRISKLAILAPGKLSVILSNN